jgi:AraC-like DNA-binding protein
MEKKFLIRIDHMCPSPPGMGFVEDAIAVLGIVDFKVFYGGAELKSALSDDQWSKLYHKLKTKGLELFRFSDCQVVEQAMLAARCWMYADIEDQSISRCDFIATHCGRKYAELDGLFNKQTGSNIENFCINDKLDCAVGLLLKTDLTIAQIIVLLNYRSEGLFFRQFREREGMSPAAFREHYQA